MVFPFSFRFPLPGITNPFASSSSVTSGPAFIPPVNTEPNIASSSRLSQADADKTLPNHTRYRRVSRANLPKINRPPPSPSPSPSPGPTGPTNSRKRGWEPTFASPSQSSTTLLSTSGYLDTPAKYREMAAAQAAGIGYEDITMSDEIARAEQGMSITSLIQISYTLLLLEVYAYMGSLPFILGRHWLSGIIRIFRLLIFRKIRPSSSFWDTLPSFFLSYPTFWLRISISLKPYMLWPRCYNDMFH
ncbi:hypothetical protein BJ165DRAFT_428563 [Panaeolus papilionaceus]|nr:hypothetical protein BJ165DRAFT_428563 [Panaeolus papilionaceus]